LASQKQPVKELTCIFSDLTKMYDVIGLTTCDLNLEDDDMLIAQ
ncbi:23321_t:CDS:1, partial [Gigaspora margarita]